jgi:hypothetical protein
MPATDPTPVEIHEFQDAEVEALPRVLERTFLRPIYA